MNNRPNPNRRDFLTAGVADALLQNPEQANASLHTRDARKQASYFEQYAKNAMACEFEISFNLHQYSQAANAAAAAFGLIDRLEDQMSVYRAHSEVTQLNTKAAQGPVKVETRLFGLLALSQEISNQTAGAFDITAGPLTKLWKFDQRSGVVPQQDQINAVLKRVGYQNLILNDVDQTIQYRIPGTEINLGGIGKGDAIDRAAQTIAALQIDNFVIQGGQSSVLALGDASAADPENASSNHRPIGWQVGLSHPTLPNVRLAEITLRNQALGTSGTGRQGFFHQGKRYGHIIDPRTGWPSSHWLSTTVITSSAARSDALATAFFVMDAASVERFCAQHSDVQAIIVMPATHENRQSLRDTADSRPSQVIPASGQLLIRTFNLEEQQFQLVASQAT